MGKDFLMKEEKGEVGRKNGVENGRKSREKKISRGPEMEVLEAERIRKEVKKEEKVEKRQRRKHGASRTVRGSAEQRKGAEQGTKWVPCSSAVNTLSGMGRTNVPSSLVKRYSSSADFLL